MKRLKADLHTHTADDPQDTIKYSAFELIDEAAIDGVEVLAITCHLEQTCTPAYYDYATARGVLLIPGVELTLDGRHVVVLNPDREQCLASTFDALRASRGRGEVVIAPHPYYPSHNCLKDELVRHADLFDAIEYCSMYIPGINPNRRAVAEARRLGLPMVGNTDSHSLPYQCRTYSWISAKKNQDAVLDAIRSGCVDVASVPAPLASFLAVSWDLIKRKAVQCVCRAQEQMASS